MDNLSLWLICWLLFWILQITSYRVEELPPEDDVRRWSLPRSISADVSCILVLPVSRSLPSRMALANNKCHVINLIDIHNQIDISSLFFLFVNEFLSKVYFDHLKIVRIAWLCSTFNSIIYWGLLYKGLLYRGLIYVA